MFPSAEPSCSLSPFLNWKIQRINWFLMNVIFLTWRVFHKLKQHRCCFRLKDPVQEACPQKRKWSICFVPPLRRWLTIGSCQARRLDSDGADAHYGAESLQGFNESHRNLAQPFRTPPPETMRTTRCPHRRNFEDNFRVFELRHPQVQTLIPHLSVLSWGIWVELLALSKAHSPPSSPVCSED